MSSSFDDRSQLKDESMSGASVAGISGVQSSSCGCLDKAEVVALMTGQVQQMIDDKLASLTAMNIESMDGKLTTLRTDLHSWTQQLVMAELANRQQTSDAQQMADRSADGDRHAELVCNPLLLLSFCA